MQLLDVVGSIRALVLAGIGLTQEDLERGKRRRRAKARVADVRAAAEVVCDRLTTRAVVRGNRWMNRQLYGEAAAELKRLKQLREAAAKRKELHASQDRHAKLHDEVMGKIRGVRTYMSDAEVAQLEPTVRFNTQLVRSASGVEKEVFIQEYLHKRSKRRFYFDSNTAGGVGIGWWAAEGERLRTHVHVNVPPAEVNRDAAASRTHSHNTSSSSGSGRRGLSHKHLVCPICEQWRRLQVSKWRDAEEKRYLLQYEKDLAKADREETNRQQKWQVNHTSIIKTSMF